MAQYEFQAQLSEHHKKLMDEIDSKEGSLGKHLEVEQDRKLFVLPTFGEQS